MGANVMQVWLRAAVIWLAGWAGVEVVRSGWRQVPMSRVDFDPALAEHFKSADRAIVYALIDKWNRWNEKHGKRDHYKDGRWWSWGSHRWWVQRFAPWMSERTWGRCIGDLVGAGLLARRFEGEQPSYSAIGYTFDETRQLELFDAQFVTRGRQIAAQGGQIGDPTIGNRFKESKPSTNRKTTTPSARARKTADAVVATFPVPAEIIGEGRDNPPEAEAREREEDGRDEAMEALRVGSRAQTSPPVPPPPSSLDRDRTAQIETVEAMPSATAIDEVTAEGGDTQELMGFFTGFGAETVRDLKAKHGTDRIYAVIGAVQQEGWAKNPPGAVLTRLRAGAKGGAPNFPQKRDPATVDEWLRGREGAKYITGKYADFIDH